MLVLAAGILIAVDNGLEAFPEAIEVVFRKPRVRPVPFIDLQFAGFCVLERPEAHCRVIRRGIRMPISTATH
jgi:hypothetical protein